MHMTDAEVKERSTLTLLRIIAQQEDEIEGLRKTLASTAQVAANAKRAAQTSLDDAWADINALIVPPLTQDYRNALIQARTVVERLGGGDPTERLHEREWSKSL